MNVVLTKDGVAIVTPCADPRDGQVVYRSATKLTEKKIKAALGNLVSHTANGIVYIKRNRLHDAVSRLRAATEPFDILAVPCMRLVSQHSTQTRILSS